MKRLIQNKNLPGFILLFTTLLFVCQGCRKLVEVDAPITSTNFDNVYTEDGTAAAVLTGIYAKISGNNFGSSPSLNSLSLFCGLSGDELVLYNNALEQVYIKYYTNALDSRIAGFECWNTIYPVVYYANAAIEGLAKSTTLTPAVKQQLLGEAKFIRAFCYFYLTNLYGDVALVTGTNYDQNATLSRAAQKDVWLQIVADLKDAENLLSENFVSSDAVTVTNERTRPSKWSAFALLARTYLYMGDWKNAEVYADKIISPGKFALESDIDRTFLAESAEAIWQLQPVIPGENTKDAGTFVLPQSGPSGRFPAYLRSDLLGRFEPGDKRREKWIGSVSVGQATYYFPFKYKVNTIGAPVTEYLVAFRLAEQYLIRSEARAMQDNIAGAAADLNVIRSRAGLPNTAAGSKETLLGAIVQERSMELFTEWGHRWFDLKRMNSIDEIMNNIAAQKGGVWEPKDKLYPLPIDDILRNSHLTQNAGY